MITTNTGTTAATVRTNNYAARKAAARQKAIEYINEQSEQAQSYFDVWQKSAHFEKLGRRYGLLREFRENAII